MATVIDSNVIAALWNLDDTLNAVARSALDGALARGSLIVPAPVYAELMAFAGRTESFLDTFLRETGIAVEWRMDEGVWRGWAGLSELRGTPAQAARAEAAPHSCRLRDWCIRRQK